MTSLVIRFETFASTSNGIRAQSAVIKSSDSHRAKRDEAVVSSRVAHDADAVDVGEHREITGYVAVDAGELNLLAEDGVRILEDA